MEIERLVQEDVSIALAIWKKDPESEENISELNGLIETVVKTGRGFSLRVKPRAFRKENLITYFPGEMEKYKVTDGDAFIFNIPTFEEMESGSDYLSLHAVTMGLPYLVLYAGSCSKEAHFAPSDVESIRVR